MKNTSVHELLCRLSVAMVLSIAALTLATPGRCQVGVPNSFADLAEQNRPIVVNIYSTQTIKARNLPYEYFFNNDQLPEMFKHFFDVPPGQNHQRHPGHAADQVRHLDDRQWQHLPQPAEPGRSTRSGT